MMKFMGFTVIPASDVPRSFRVGPNALVLPHDEVVSLMSGDRETQVRVLREIRDWELSRAA